MKTKLIFLTIIFHFMFMPVFSDQMDCTQFKKLSAKYIECNAKKFRNKTNEKVKISKEKFKRSGIKDKFKKFKENKTLADLIKD